MKGFLLYFVLPVTVIGIFFSGSFSHTLIYDEEDLKGLKYEGKEPVSAEVVKCEIQNADSLTLGAVMETTFRATLKNHTNRYVVISAIGEVFSPRGRSGGMHSQMFILNPNAVEETTFRSNTPYTVRGRYRCEMRYAIGRFKY
jgi:hypothetical protein